MNRISFFATLVLFARTAMRRLINRSAALNFSALRKKSSVRAEAPPRTATLHRNNRKSILGRILGMWLPITSMLGMLMLSINTMFILVGTVLRDESKTAAVLCLSPDEYNSLQRAAAIAGKQERAAAVRRALNEAYAGPAPWLSASENAIAQQRFDRQGMPAFAPLAPDSRWCGTLAYLSPAGRAKGLRIIGVYLALLNLGIACFAFGLMGKSLSTADPTLTWLWQLPVSRKALFTAKLIECMCDNPAAPAAAIFYAIVLCLCGKSFGAGLGIGLLLGLAAAVTGAAARLAVEVFMTQRLSRRARGAIVAASTTTGSLAILLAMVGCNSQSVVELFMKMSSALPHWLCWNPFTAGIGSDAMLAGNAAWWLVAPAIATALGITSVLLAVGLTRRGLATPLSSKARVEPPTVRTPARTARLGAVAAKELLRMRRQPEMLGQILAAPLMIATLLYVAGYTDMIDLALRGGTTIAAAVLAAAAYMLFVAAGQTIGSELKSLWLLQCQPRPLADVVREKARVWGAIAVGMSLPFIGFAIAMRPSEAESMLVRLPFLILALWLLAELVFGLTALAASVADGRTVRFARSAMLIPSLVAANAALAINSQSWWLQLSVLFTLVILAAAARERQLAELPWLSEPVETPPKQFSPMHGMLAVVAFQVLMGSIGAALMQRAGLSGPAASTPAYSGAAIVATAICALWLRRRRITRYDGKACTAVSPHSLPDRTRYSLIKSRTVPPEGIIGNT